MELAERVYQYYLDNQQSLSAGKLFHLGTRMAAWRGDKAAYDILRRSYDYIVQPSTPLEQVLWEIYQSPNENTHELRRPFFDTYPHLYGAQLALFRTRHLASVYGIDAREALFQSISLDELSRLEDALLHDREAIRILSTFAVNFCYLLERVVKENDSSLDVEDFYDIGLTYDTDTPRELQLLIYLYTHCIIGESNFYTRVIPADKLALYRTMLVRLESLIEQHFTHINLDNKLEFLVCARICDFPSTLYDRVYEECSKSLSPEGTFLVDTVNQNGKAALNGFVRSEHRNVLFIMSSTAYAPHSTLVR